MAITRTTSRASARPVGRSGRSVALASSSRFAPRTRAGLRVCLAVAVAAGASIAHAQNWRFEPSVDALFTLTDNVNLTPTDRKSDFVTQLTPALKFSEQSARTRLRGTIEAPILLYARTGGENNDVVPQVDSQHVIERQEHRELRDHRQAGGEGVDLVLPVEAHHLLVEALLVVLVLVLERLDLRLESRHRLHRLELLERQRQQRRADEQRQRDDRRAPADPDVVVEELEDPLEDIDQGLEDVGEEEHGDQECDAGMRGARGGRRNKVCADTGSYPPWLKGLQRSSRHPASTEPRSMP